MQVHAAVQTASIVAFVFAGRAWYLAEPWTNCFVRLQTPPAVTCTVKLVDAEAVLPALSVADAVIVCAPGPKLHAGAFTFAQFVVARPESASDAVHVNVTCWSTVYVAAWLPKTTVGLVLSIETVFDAEAELPALSVQVPLAVWFAPCDENVTGLVTEATPEVASVQVNVTVTFVLFHP